MARGGKVRRQGHPHERRRTTVVLNASDVRRAIAATMATASELGLAVEDAIVVHNSNKLALRLMPCDTFARVAHAGREIAAFEVELALQLARAGSPAAALEPRVEPRPYDGAGLVFTLWTYYESAPSGAVSPGEFAHELERLHAGMRGVGVTSIHFTERIADAVGQVASSRDPSLGAADRELLLATLRDVSRSIVERGAAEQLLHGEPHPGNVLATSGGLRFIDFESCCVGPVEFDVAHAPGQVGEHYSGADLELLSDCRQLALAVAAAWRFEPDDQLPNRERFAQELLHALRDGPPWPALEVVGRRASSL